MSRAEYLKTQEYQLKKQGYLEAFKLLQQDEMTPFFGNEYSHFGNDLEVFANDLYQQHKQKGAKIIITGGPGTGKTTLLQLLQSIIDKDFDVITYYEDDQHDKIKKLKLEMTSAFLHDSYNGYIICDGLYGFSKVHEQHLYNEKCISAVPVLEFLSYQKVADIDHVMHVKLDKLSIFIPETITINHYESKKIRPKKQV